MPRGGGSPGRRSDPTNIDTRGSKNSALNTTITRCHNALESRGRGSGVGGRVSARAVSLLAPDPRPPTPAPRLFSFISSPTPTPGSGVLQEDDQRRHAVEDPDHRRSVPEAEVLEGVVVYLEG